MMRADWQDIRVTRLEPAPPAWHAQFSATSKLYLYQVNRLARLGAQVSGLASASSGTSKLYLYQVLPPDLEGWGRR